MIAILDAAAQGYVSAVRNIIVEDLRDQLVGCYVYGSVLTLEFIPGRSDLDMLVVTRTWMPRATEQTVIERLRMLARPAAVKGLDIWFLPLAISRNPYESPGYQVRMLTSFDYIQRSPPNRRGDPRLAMLLAICRNHSAVVSGPAPVSVIGRVPLSGILSGMYSDLSSHAPAHYRMLNACRDQHFLDEGRMCSKLQGAAWARGRMAPPDLLDAAVEWHRRGTGPLLQAARVAAVVSAVSERLRDAVQLGDLPAACHRWRPLDPAPLSWPKVICLMPTYNRRRFVEQSIRLFGAQTYPNRELVIVDDGEDEVSDLVPAGANVRHVRMKGRTTIGEKRNVGAQVADGDIVVQWDDDDWYGPSRLSRQVEPLVAGRADLTAIQKSWLADLDDGRFYRHRFQPQPLIGSLAAGTIAMTTDVWRRSGGYPDASKREDITMLHRAIDFGVRVEGVPNDGLYVYVRHGSNSWQLDRTPSEHTWWAESAPPRFIPRRELDGYFRARNAAGLEQTR